MTSTKQTLIQGDEGRTMAQCTVASALSGMLVCSAAVTFVGRGRRELEESIAGVAGEITDLSIAV
jgi:hypothetical protein